MDAGAEAEESCLQLLENLYGELSLLVTGQALQRSYLSYKRLELSSGGEKNSFVPEIKKLDQDRSRLDLQHTFLTLSNL